MDNSAAVPKFDLILNVLSSRDLLNTQLSTMAGPSAIDYLEIKNTTARYCIALDSKDFSLLRDVFTEDVQCRFPFSNPAGLDNVSAAIEKRLRPVTSQHAVTTQLIEIAPDGKTATATSYFTGIHFGKGKWDGKDVTAWGQYQDEFVADPSRKSVAGTQGAWLIKKRTVTFFGRRGEEGVMDGE